MTIEFKGAYLQYEMGTQFILKRAVLTVKCDFMYI